MSNFDLSAFESAETAILEVKDITGNAPLLFDGKPVQIELYGPGSDKGAAALSEFQTGLRTALFRAQQNLEQNADEPDLMAERLAKVTRTLINFPIPGGAAELYRNKKLAYITRQASVFIDSWANFPPACTKG